MTLADRLNKFFSDHEEDYDLKIPMKRRNWKGEVVCLVTYIEDFVYNISESSQFDIPEIGWVNGVDDWNNGDGHSTGVVLEKDGEYAAMFGTYSSWDASSYDDEWVAVTKVEPKFFHWNNGKTTYGAGLN